MSELFEKDESVDTQVVKKIVSTGFQKSKKRKVEDRESWWVEKLSLTILSIF